MIDSSDTLLRTPPTPDLRNHRLRRSTDREALLLKVAAAGMAAAEPFVAELLEAGRARGIAAGVLDALADPQICEAMRVRALARTVSALIE